MVNPLVQPQLQPQPQPQPPSSSGPPGPNKPNWEKIGAIAAIVGIIVGAAVTLAVYLIPREDFLDFVRKLVGAQPSQGGVQTGEEEPAASSDDGVQQPTAGETKTGESQTEQPGAPEPAPEHTAEKEPTPGPTPAGEDPPEVKEEARTEETPNDSQVLPDDQDPEFQEGVVVTARYVDPTGPRVRGELSLPRLPTDALRSLAAGKELVVRVRVDPEGRATVTEIDGVWLLEAVQQRVRESLERRPWIPGTDTSGAPRESEAVVVFSWRK